VKLSTFPIKLECIKLNTFKQHFEIFNKEPLKYIVIHFNVSQFLTICTLESKTRLATVIVQLYNIQ